MLRKKDRQRIINDSYSRCRAHAARLRRPGLRPPTIGGAREGADDVVFIDEIPKTSVGKFDKKVLRERYQDFQA